MANLTDFPHTTKNHTQLTEIQILKPEDTKQIRPIGAAALTLLQDPDDIRMYVKELMKSNTNAHIDENFWFPTPENPENQGEHTPIQRRILNEIRELIKKEDLDPTNEESRKRFLEMFKWEGSQIDGNDRKKNCHDPLPVAVVIFVTYWAREEDAATVNIIEQQQRKPIWSILTEQLNNL